MRPGSTVACLGGALILLTGCGEERVVVAPQSVYDRPARPAVLAAPGEFELEEVRTTVARFTGHRLRVEDRADRFVTLGARPGGDEALGIFSLYVARDRRTRDALMRPDGPGRPYRDQGIRFVDGDASAAFGDTVYLRTVQKPIDDRFRRLVRALGAMGAPAGSARGRPPPEQRPCPPTLAQLGALEERTCRLGAQSATFVNRDATLVLRGARVRVIAVEVPDKPVRLGLGDRLRRPHGRVVTVRVRADNPAGGVGLGGPGPEFDTELELDGQRFEGVNGRIPEEEIFFALSPNDDDELVLGFDVPRSLAARAERDGTLVVTGRAEQRLLHPRDSPIAARLRLRPH